ncbi:MAG TPA: PTS sugar transporter subunit IIB [Longimicrobiales bacterium]|nr:PTS sugar transporter subunit IIB [Longimicrobiales bacterium]
MLFRIDERLIHGQVVVAWGAQLHPDRIVVVNDELADSAWEQELYCLGLPADTAAEFASVADARARLDEWRESPERVFLLARDVATMARLGQDGLLQGTEVNIGGIHHAPDRREVLPYVFLSEHEEEVLRELAGQGADVSARDLPGGRRVPLAQLLSGGSQS